MARGKRTTTEQTTEQTTTEVDGVAVPIANGDALCQRLFAAQMKFGILAADLLAACGGEQAKALARWVAYLRGISPEFKPSSEKLGARIRKGGDLYELQRAYNALYFHYRADKGERKGKARTFTATLAAFLTTARGEGGEMTGEQMTELFNALTEGERDTLAALFAAEGEQE